MRNFRGPLFVVLALLLATFACGEETAEKVGEVAGPPPTSEEQRPPATAAEASAATEAPAPTEPSPSIEAPAPTDIPAPEGPTAYQVGDIVSIGDMVLVVLGWDSPPKDEFTKPEEGNRFVAVDLLLVNQGDETKSVSSMLQMTLKDDTGQRYNEDLMAAVATGYSGPDGELAPGERLRGKVGYQVPEGVTSLIFVFDADVWGTGKVFVDLGPEPVTMQPPAELVGEQAQEAFAIGDVVEIGNWTITVHDVTYPEGDEFTKPEEGHKFIVVDLTLENTGTQADAVSSMMQMYVKDASGQKYELDLMASVASGGTTPDGEVAPGEKIRGQAGYQLPEEIEGLVFVFDGDVWGHGKVFVALP
jgi:hypothetical protein